ncbi:hypothetical protein HDU79_002303 [Rhizoclosmatium sp. JEL0117]|nr:hypothetical protein HDU79_002303 [Rhizoclosmatium sp. JEL0117]
MRVVANARPICPINAKLLRILSRMEETATSFISHNGIDLIFQMISAHPESVQIQIDSSAVIANLSNVSSARTYIQQKTSYISMILANMRKWAHEETVQTEMCAIISNLAQCDSTAGMIVQRGGCALIRDAMMLHVDVEDLQVQGLHALSALVKSAKRHLNTNLAASYTECIVQAFTRWKDSMSVCSAASNCVGMFSFVQLKLTRPMESIILDAMKRFHDVEKFQITACFALAHLKAVLGSETRLEIDIIDQILKVIENFPYHRNILTTALFALGSYAAQSEPNSLHIMSKKGISSVIRSMVQTNFKGEVHSLEVCMKHMAVHESHEGDDKTSKGVPKSDLLKLFGSMCLMNMSENEKCRQEIISQGGVHAVFDAALSIHKSNAHVPKPPLVTNLHSLEFVVTYVFRKITCSQSRFYSRPSTVPSLKTLAKNAVLKGFKTQYDAEKPIFTELNQFLDEKMEASCVPALLAECLGKYVECRQCKTLYDGSTGITGHEIYGGKDIPKVTRLCSAACFGRFDMDKRSAIALVDPCFDEYE